MANILLIEDNPSVSFAVQTMLEALGHWVHTAPNGSAGLSLLQEHPDLDLVFTDIMMPVLDGISVLLQLRQQHPELPVVAMTGRQDSSYLRTAGQLGARATLYKPFNLQELKELLASIGFGTP